MSAIIGIAALGSFTFHYVSINTEIGVPYFSTSEVFTFHYVSINTRDSTGRKIYPEIFTFHYVSINTPMLQWGKR